MYTAITLSVHTMETLKVYSLSKFQSYYTQLLTRVTVHIRPYDLLIE